MKTIIFYALLFFVCIFAFNGNAESYNVIEIDKGVEWVEQNADQIDEATGNQCGSIVQFGQAAFDMKEEGSTLDDTLGELYNSLKKYEQSTGKQSPNHLRLSFERMIRTIYRYPEVTKEDHSIQFFAECVILNNYRYK